MTDEWENEVALRFCGGDSVKHSPSGIEPDMLGAPPVANFIGGSWLSRPVEVNGMVFVEYPFVRAREGRRKADFLRLNVSC